MNPESSPVQYRKPKFAYGIATVLGIGYLPKAPGTFGSVAGCVLTIGFVFVSRVVFFYVLEQLTSHDSRDTALDWMTRHGTVDFWLFLLPSIFCALFVASIGVRCADRVAEYEKVEDPQHVVIDEVSGQQLTYLLGLTPFFLPRHDVVNPDFIGYGASLGMNLLNWKCLLLGFILFRLFDIWKPFPARQLENLPGGWGIMADDWMAGIYAALLLQVALHFRLL